MLEQNKKNTALLPKKHSNPLQKRIFASVVAAKWGDFKQKTIEFG